MQSFTVLIIFLAGPSTHLLFSIILITFPAGLLTQSHGSLTHNKYCSQLMSRVRAEDRLWSWCSREQATTLRWVPIHSEHTPQKHPCLSLTHSIDHMCFPTPCPAWSLPQRDVFERLLQQRENPSPRPVVTDLNSEWGCKKWRCSFLSLSFPPLPIFGIFYTPISCVSFSWGHLHSLSTVCSKCLSSKSSIYPSLRRHFAAPLWHSRRHGGTDSTEKTEFPLPHSNNAQGLLCYFQGIFGTSVSWELKHICYWSADTHTQPMSQFEPVQFLTLII